MRSIFRGAGKRFDMWGKNAKLLVLTEPLWSLPMSWVFFYRPIFLRQSIGLSEVQMGFLFTILSFFTAFSPLAGGYLADRFGRKRIFMLFDSMGWLSAIAVWIITNNVWLAVVAYVLEGTAYVTYSVWECLLVEDTAPEYRASVYGTVSSVFSLGSLSTPIAGYIVGVYGIDQGVRLLFSLAFASMVPMFTIRQLYLRETEIGSQIMKEKTFAGLKGYLDSLSVIKRNRIIVALLLTSTISTFYYSVSTYLPLYLIDERGLGLTKEAASLIPAASSITGLVIASLLVPRLTSRSGYMKSLSAGYALGSLGILLLSFSPRDSLLLAMISGVVLGVYLGTSFAVSRTFLTNEIEEADSRARAKILSITVTLSYLLNLPSPALAGYLFSLEPKYPFILVSGLLTASLVVLVLATRKRRMGANAAG